MRENHPIEIAIVVVWILMDSVLKCIKHGIVLWTLITTKEHILTYNATQCHKPYIHPLMTITDQMILLSRREIQSLSGIRANYAKPKLIAAYLS